VILAAGQGALCRGDPLAGVPVGCLPASLPLGTILMASLFRTVLEWISFEHTSYNLRNFQNLYIFLHMKVPIEIL
jgi:hypothetical protein